jgi:LacI family transcriptional regulator
MKAQKTKPISRQQRRPRVLISLGQGKYVQSIIDLAREWEWDLLDLELMSNIIPNDRPSAGAIVDCLPTDPLTKLLRKRGIPVVRIGRCPHPRDALAPAVLPDLTAIGRLAANHFAERDFKNLAFLGQNPWGDFRGVYDGFRLQIKELGLPKPTLFRIPSAPEGIPTGDRQARRKWQSEQIGEWLVSLPKATGVLIPDDARASSMCQICVARGIAIPDDVALLGVGNGSRFCEMAAVSLSSIDPDRREQSRQAALILRRLMAGEPVDARLLVPPCGLVTRRSTDVLAVADPLVAKAMRYIWDHYDSDLVIADVAEASETSPRTLQRAFQREFGQGVIAMLRRKRLNEMCHLLCSTDLPAIDLAAKVGFRSYPHMHCAFCAAYQLTPRQYRLKHRRKPYSGN